MNVRQPAGFSLIEVLVAVAVLAFALSTVLFAAANFTDNAVYLRDKAVTAIVARNVIVDYQLAATWPEPGRKDGEMDMAGQPWPWEALIQKTEDPNLRRIDVQVFRPDGEDSVIRLTAFLGASGSTGSSTGTQVPGGAGIGN